MLLLVLMLVKKYVVVSIWIMLLLVLMLVKKYVVVSIWIMLLLVKKLCSSWYKLFVCLSAYFDYVCNCRNGGNVVA